MMRILYCHNYYQQRGGEDLSFEADVRMLREAGHDVVTYTRHNDELAGRASLKLAWETIWNTHAEQEISELLSARSFDVMHCNNLFPQISPSIYRAAERHGVPVVQALRNYRMFCAGAFLHRDDHVCTQCIGKALPIAGLWNRCYRDSLAATSVVATAQVAHRLLGTWKHRVAMFFTPSAFARQVHIEAGVPEDKIAVKPNFIDPDPGIGEGNGGYAIFVGRLSPEKGVDLMLRAWEEHGVTLPLRVVGDGPLRERITSSNANVTWLGQKSPAEVLEEIGGATCLIMPSQWYETFGRTIIEAFSRGVPAIVTDFGAMAELVEDGFNGYRVPAGDPAALAEAVERVIALGERSIEMREAARNTYLKRYTKTASLAALQSIYETAIRNQTSSNGGMCKLLNIEGPS